VTAEPLPVVVALDRDAFVRGKPDRAALVDAFVEARLLTLEGGARLLPTHDALLRIWPDASKRVAEMAGLIRARHALAPLAEAWDEAPPGEKSRHLQLSAPLLASGQQLEDRFGEDLREPLRGFIAEAEKSDAARRARETRRTRIVIVASLAAAAVMALFFAGAVWQWREAAAQRAAAVAAKTDADQQRIAALESAKEANKQKAVAERNLAIATEAANALVVDLAQRFRTVSGVPVSLVKTILDRARDLQEQLLGAGQSSPALLRSQAVALVDTSDTLLTLGDTKGALDSGHKAADLFEGLLKAAT
jgi:hypothetical protein